MTEQEFELDDSGKSYIQFDDELRLLIKKLARLHGKHSVTI